MRENKPKISIITPTLNVQNNIEACILNVATQNYKNIEHLIIDGLSTDKTLEIITKYLKIYPHIKLISEKDKGIYDAMNKGIDISNGEWIYFLGSDDIFIDNKVLEKIFLKTNDYKFFDLLYGNVVWGDTQKIYDGKFSPLKLIGKNICHQAMFFKKELFRKFGKFDINYKVSSDWVFNMKVFASDDVRKKYINITIAKYAINGASSFHNDDLLIHNLSNLIKINFPDEYEESIKIKNKNQEIVNLNQAIKQKDQEVQFKKAELEGIYSSRGWKITLLMRNILSTLIPEGSLRKKKAVSFWHFIKSVMKIFRHFFHQKIDINYIQKVLKKKFTKVKNRI